MLNIGTISDQTERCRVLESNILAKHEYFIDVGIWPWRSVINPSEWLTNFDQSEQEREHALYLLDSFMFFSDELVGAMFASAFQSISTQFVHTRGNFRDVQQQWDQFLGTVIVTFVTGNEANPSDSGRAFADRGRRQLRIDEKQIMTPRDAILRRTFEPHRPIVFVDDFVGTGDQFLRTWQRTYTITDALSSSFADLGRRQAGGGGFYYCPLVCTAKGFACLREKCPEVVLYPGHVLTAEYSALAKQSVIWPEHLRATATSFLQTASQRAGIRGWKGYKGLGYAIAFQNSVPNATLPILWWEENGWKPLVKKT